MHRLSCSGSITDRNDFLPDPDHNRDVTIEANGLYRETNMNSELILCGPAQAPRRGLLKCCSVDY